MNLAGLTDPEIWSLFTKGDNKALAFIYTEYSAKLYYYGLKFTTDPTMVEDSIQDLFKDLIINRKNLGLTDNILYYLFKAFKRNLMKKIQKKKKSDPREVIVDQEFDITWSVEHDIILDETTREKTKVLKKALENLTPRQKETIYLRFSKELDYESIAGIMEISVEACRNLIYNSVKTLKESIRKEANRSLIFFLGPFRFL